MSRRGRFGKYGEVKRKSKLRAARVSLRDRLRSKVRLAGAQKKSAGSKSVRKLGN